MEGIQNKIERSRLKWFRYVKGMDKYRISKKIIGNKDELKTQGQNMHPMDR
jgi:hypothetical protein